MASTLKINTLTGVTTAGSIAVTGEGNSTTTNLQQGLAKVWGVVTVSAVSDSLNVSGLTDNQAGDFSVNLTNAYQSADYCVHYTLGVTGGARVCPMYEHDQRVTNRTDLFSFNHNGNSLIDPNGSMYSSYGDLA